MREVVSQSRQPTTVELRAQNYCHQDLEQRNHEQYRDRTDTLDKVDRVVVQPREPLIPRLRLRETEIDVLMRWKDVKGRHLDERIEGLVEISSHRQVI